MAVIINDDDDESSDDDVDEVAGSGDDEEEEGGVEAGGKLLGHEGSDDDGDDDEVKGILDVHEIDAHWLQRGLSKYYDDADISAKLAEEVLGIMQLPDERECENKLVTILDYDKFDFIKVLMCNRNKIVYCTKLKQAQTDEERSAIEEQVCVVCWCCLLLLVFVLLVYSLWVHCLPPTPHVAHVNAVVLTLLLSLSLSLLLSLSLSLPLSLSPSPDAW